MPRQQPSRRAKTQAAAGPATGHNAAQPKQTAKKTSKRVAKPTAKRQPAAAPNSRSRAPPKPVPKDFVKVASKTAPKRAPKTAPQAAPQNAPAASDPAPEDRPQNIIDADSGAVPGAPTSQAANVASAGIPVESPRPAVQSAAEITVSRWNSMDLGARKALAASFWNPRKDGLAELLNDRVLGLFEKYRDDLPELVRRRVNEGLRLRKTEYQFLILIAYFTPSPQAHHWTLEDFYQRHPEGLGDAAVLYAACSQALQHLVSTSPDSLQGAVSCLGLSAPRTLNEAEFTSLRLWSALDQASGNDSRLLEDYGDFGKNLADRARGLQADTSGVARTQVLAGDQGCQRIVARSTGKRIPELVETLWGGQQRRPERTQARQPEVESRSVAQAPKPDGQDGTGRPILVEDRSLLQDIEGAEDEPEEKPIRLFARIVPGQEDKTGQRDGGIAQKRRPSLVSTEVEEAGHSSPQLHGARTMKRRRLPVNGKAAETEKEPYMPTTGEPSTPILVDWSPPNPHRSQELTHARPVMGHPDNAQSQYAWKKLLKWASIPRDLLRACKAEPRDTVLAAYEAMCLGLRGDNWLDSRLKMIPAEDDLLPALPNQPPRLKPILDESEAFWLEFLAWPGYEIGFLSRPKSCNRPEGRNGSLHSGSTSNLSILDRTARVINGKNLEIFGVMENWHDLDDFVEKLNVFRPPVHRSQVIPELGALEQAGWIKFREYSEANHERGYQVRRAAKLRHSEDRLRWDNEILPPNARHPAGLPKNVCVVSKTQAVAEPVSDSDARRSREFFRARAFRFGMTLFRLLQHAKADTGAIKDKQQRQHNHRFFSEAYNPPDFLGIAEKFPVDAPSSIHSDSSDSDGPRLPYFLRKIPDGPPNDFSGKLPRRSQIPRVRDKAAAEKMYMENVEQVNEDFQLWRYVGPDDEPAPEGQKMFHPVTGEEVLRIQEKPDDPPGQSYVQQYLHPRIFTPGTPEFWDGDTDYQKKFIEHQFRMQLETRVDNRSWWARLTGKPLECPRLVTDVERLPLPKIPARKIMKSRDQERAPESGAGVARPSHRHAGHAQGPSFFFPVPSQEAPPVPPPVSEFFFKPTPTPRPKTAACEELVRRGKTYVASMRAAGKPVGPLDLPPPSEYPVYYWSSSNEDEDEGEDEDEHGAEDGNRDRGVRSAEERNIGEEVRHGGDSEGGDSGEEVQVVEAEQVEYVNDSDDDSADGDSSEEAIPGRPTVG